MPGDDGTAGEQRGIEMTFPEFDSPCFVKADRTRLKQILINLLSNGIKYNKEQGRSSWTAPSPPRNVFASASRTLAPDCLRKSWRNYSNRSIVSARKLAAWKARASVSW